MFGSVHAVKYHQIISSLNKEMIICSTFSRRKGYL